MSFRSFAKEIVLSITSAKFSKILVPRQLQLINTLLLFIVLLAFKELKLLATKSEKRIFAEVQHV